MPGVLDLREWTERRVTAACSRDYRTFHAMRRARHVAYYAAREGQRSLNPNRPYEAAEQRWAFPPGWEHLAELAGIRWHVHSKSAGSSQALAISLLEPAIDADPSISWLLKPRGPLPAIRRVQRPRFEVGVSPELLRESPHVTSLDWLVETESGVLAAEAKFLEEGMGKCDCANKADGDCSGAVRSRPYWEVPRAHFGWDGPHPPEPCPLSLTYQAVRNVAAALALAGPGRVAVWALFYDAENPYSTGAGEWPGWVRALNATLSDTENFRFRAFSWQQLLTVLPLPEDVRTWAEEKHGLSAVTAS